MNKEQVQKLDHGCYMVHWKHDPENEEDNFNPGKAVVGSTHDGTRWIAFSNWVFPGSIGVVGTTDLDVWNNITTSTSS